MEEKIRLYQFWAAMFFIAAALGYYFACIFVKPVVDLTSSISNVAMLLIGYYFGSSKSSQDKGDAMKTMEKK
jgi:hypothetical protein